MGFFGKLFGEPSKSVTKSGFQELPAELQAPFTQFGEQLTSTFADRPTPTPSPEEMQAFSQISAGVAPTPETLGQDISMFMNPFDKFVIDEINRQSTGERGLLSQEATRAGQIGSSREFVGAEDIERRRLSDIGRLKQGQFNQAIQNVLGPLSGLKQQDIANLLTSGQLQRDIPFQDLERFGGLLSTLPQSGGTTSVQKGGTPGILSTLSGASKSAGEGAAGFATAAALSSRKLKENIVKVGEENGFNIYHFNYKDNPNTRYEGVMAEEVEKIRPDAITEIDGNKAVYYSKLGLEMKEVV